MKDEGTHRHTEYSSRTQALFVTGILVFLTALSFLDRQALSLLVVPIENQLGFSDTQMGLLLGPAFVLFYAIGGLPIGILADTYSRRNILAAGVVIWSLSTVTCGLAESFHLIFLARSGVGLGEACLIPTAYSLIADYFPPERRGRAVAVVSMGISIGSGAALFGGGLLLTWADALRGVDFPIIGRREPWQLVFICCGLPGLVGTALLLCVREPNRQNLVSEKKMIGKPSDFLNFTKVNAVSLILIIGTYTLFVFMQYANSAWTPTLLVRSHGLTPAHAAYVYGLVTILFAPCAALAGGFVGDRLGHALIK